uniref:ParB/Sulfiredoxin domain-containing protein n=1 Tax=Desulfobacca acetoxidans TaxID=60893 RepID=A0A7V4LD49_9BACT
MEFRWISLATVDLAEHFIRVPGAPETAALRESLAEVGLLSLPRLLPHQRRRWRVITGWKRLKAALHLGWDEVPAVPLPASTPDSHLLLLYLYDNAFTRPFTPQEQARLALRLLTHFDREKVIRKFLPLLGQPGTPGHLDRLLAAAKLEDPWQELLAQGRLALSAAARLAAWDPTDRLAAYPFFQHLPLSQSKQEELLEDAELLARRAGIAPAAILLRWELQKLLMDQGRSPQERTGAIRSLLKHWVSPRLMQTRKAFRDHLDALGLTHHPRIRLSSPPAFEGPDYHLEIKFQNAADLADTLKELTRLLHTDSFAKLTAL